VTPAADPLTRSSDARTRHPSLRVIGATGQQCGAVVDALLAAGHPVRALVRDPDSAKSRALAHRQVTPVHADQDDADSMIAALDDVAALFMMTTFAGPKGAEGEIAGRAIADAAVRARVPRVVYSSVGGAEPRTGHEVRIVEDRRGPGEGVREFHLRDATCVRRT